MSYIQNCKFCGASIFWLNDGERNIPFEDTVITISKAGQKYADGFDNIKISAKDDIGKTKGFLCHFGKCKR